jgi:hypothetical protein
LERISRRLFQHLPTRTSASDCVREGYLVC